MGKNILPVIAKELGVKIGTVFTVKGNEDQLFRLTDNWIEYCFVDEEQPMWLGGEYDDLFDLILGNSEIEKIINQP